MDSPLPVENSQQSTDDSNITNTHLKPGHASRRAHEHTSKHGDNTKMLHRKLECGSEEIDIVLHGPSFNLMNHEPAMHSCPELGCWYDQSYVRIASLMSGWWLLLTKSDAAFPADIIKFTQQPASTQAFLTATNPHGFAEPARWSNSTSVPLGVSAWVESIYLFYFACRVNRRFGTSSWQRSQTKGTRL